MNNSSNFVYAIEHKKKGLALTDDEIQQVKHLCLYHVSQV